MRFRLAWPLAILATLACDGSPTDPSGLGGRDGDSGSPASSYNDVSGCITLIWDAVEPAYICDEGDGFNYPYRFANGCGFDVRVTWMSNEHGRTASYVDDRVAENGGRYSQTLDPYEEDRIQNNLYCPGGDGRPYVSFCYYDPRNTGACRRW